MGGSEDFLQGLKPASPTHSLCCMQEVFVNVTDGAEVVLMWIWHKNECRIKENLVESTQGIGYSNNSPSLRIAFEMVQ